MLAAFAALMLAGCASPPPDSAFGTVEQLAHERIGHPPVLLATDEQARAAGARVVELLRRPLDADAAVEIALLHNRELQASYAELGIAQADLAHARSWPAPSIRFGRLSGGGSVEIDRAVVFDLLALLTRPLTVSLEQQRLEQVQLRAAADTVALATSARKAFFNAVASQQLLGYYETVNEAAEASSELARRMAAAGNFSQLDQMREQAFHGEAVAQLGRAKQRAVAAREQLVRVLGVDGAERDFKLPERLPDLPNTPLDTADAEQTAMDQRLDIRMARRETQAIARALGLTQATRFVNVLNASYQGKGVTGEATSRGYEVELELPLFDFGSARVARAEAIYRQSMARTAALALRARSEVREAYSAYRSAHELARHYRDEVVPLRQRISEQNLLRYNGMLASVFDLLADAREQVAAVSAAVEALRDYWLAETTLQIALSGGSPEAGADMAAPPTRAAAASRATH